MILLYYNLYFLDMVITIKVYYSCFHFLFYWRYWMELAELVELADIYRWHCFVNSNRISHVLESLKSFHSNKKFTIEIEKGNKISFLDILLISYKDLISTTMYRKKTNTDLYINWKPFSSNNWKWGTLKTLVLRTYDICSTGKYL